MLAADLMVPPLSLFVLVALGVMVINGLMSLFGATTWPFHLAFEALTMVFFAVLVGWIRFGRKSISAKSLLSVPKYLVWKIPVYASLVFKGKKDSWDRTSRDVTPQAVDTKAVLASEVDGPEAPAASNPQSAEPVPAETDETSSDPEPVKRRNAKNRPRPKRHRGASQDRRNASGQERRNDSGPRTGQDRRNDI